MPKYVGGNVIVASATPVLSFTNNRLVRISSSQFVDSLLSDDGTNITLTSGHLIVPAGTLALPSLTFAGDTDTGIWGESAGRFIFVADAAEQMSIQPGVVRLQADVQFGFSAGNPSGAPNDITLIREAAAILQQGLDSATPIAQTYKGADGSGTDIVGGVMRQASGRSTGNADPAILSLQGTAVSVTSGSTQQTLIDRFIPNAFVILTDGSAIAVVNVTVATETVTGGIISYTIEVTDGTDVQVESGQAVYSTSNKAGTVAGTITEINSQQNLSVGTLATTWAISNANPAVISINANSSLTPSTGYPRITFSLSNFGQQTVAIQ